MEPLAAEAGPLHTVAGVRQCDREETPWTQSQEEANPGGERNEVSAEKC